VSAPVGRREFFALEAGEYLERLALLVSGAGAPDDQNFVRYARALRGAALMAGPPGYANAAAAFETVAKAARDGSLEWTRRLADRLADGLEECKSLLHALRDWSDVHVQRCEQLAEQLENLVGAAAIPTGSGDLGGNAGLSAGVRAYVAREAAAVAATLEQVAEAVEQRPAPGSADPLLQRLQPLRGLGALPGLSPLPELIEAIDLTIAFAGKGGAWPAASGRAFRAAAAALARMARDIAELGIPQPDAQEVVQATELFRDTFAREDDVVPIASLCSDPPTDAIVQRGTPPAPPAPISDPTMEMVSLADRLRHASEQSREGASRSTRALQLYALVLVLRGLAMSPGLRGATGNLLCRLDRETMAGRALPAGSRYAAVLSDAAAAIAHAAEIGAVAELGAALEPLCRELDRIGGIAQPPVEQLDIVPIEALAPELDTDADVVSIQSLFYHEMAAGAPVGGPGYLPFEQTFSTYSRLIRSEPVAIGSPIVPIESLAPDAPVVQIESLLFRGRRALERADVVRRELDAALRAHRGLTGVETLLTELLDLVPLALADDR
jgi:HPt (histidine-containing phosphotransfer) domain-containing protein